MCQDDRREPREDAHRVPVGEWERKPLVVDAGAGRKRRRQQASGEGHRARDGHRQSDPAKNQEQVSGRSRVQADADEHEQVKERSIELGQGSGGRIRPPGRQQNPRREQGKRAGRQAERSTPARKWPIYECEPSDEQQTQKPRGQPDAGRKEPASAEREHRGEGARQDQEPIRHPVDERTSQLLPHSVVTCPGAATQQCLEGVAAPGEGCWVHQSSERLTCRISGQTSGR